MALIGSVASAFEHAFAAVWSVAEVGLTLTRPSELLRDPHRDALRDDLRARGFHLPIDAAALDLDISSRGTIRGTNPYVRIGAARADRVLAHLHRAPRRARHL